MVAVSFIGMESGVKVKTLPTPPTTPPHGYKADLYQPSVNLMRLPY